METPTEEGSCPIPATIYASYQELFEHTSLRMAPPSKATLHSQTIYFHLFHHSSLYPIQPILTIHLLPAFISPKAILQFTSLLWSMHKKLHKVITLKSQKYHVYILKIGPISIPLTHISLWWWKIADIKCVWHLTGWKETNVRKLLHENCKQLTLHKHIQLGGVNKSGWGS